MGNEKYFDENVLYYDKYRPDYPDELFSDIVSYSGVHAGSLALEIGSGTGKATHPVLERGIRVIALEPGANLASFTRDKYRNYPNFTAINVRFEDYSPEEQTELIYSATAFHWIPSDTGYTRCKQLLKAGGTLAAFWNTPGPSPASAELDGKIQKLYDIYMPEVTKSSQSYEERCSGIQWEFNYYGYNDTVQKLYKGHRCFDADGYIGLLHTYSNHMALPQSVREEFFAKIHELICVYGIIEIEDTVDLHMGRTKK